MLAAVLDALVATITTLVVVAVGLVVVHKRHGHRLVQIVVDRTLEKASSEFLQDRQLFSQQEDRDSETARNFALVSTEDARRLRLKSIQVLWDELLSLHGKSAPLVGLEAILTQEEFAGVMSGKSPSSDFQAKLIRVIVDTWKAPDAESTSEGNDKEIADYFSEMIGSCPQPGASAMPFVDAKLWVLYTKISQIQRRFCTRVVWEIERGGAYCWREDEIIRECVAQCGCRDAWKEAAAMPFGGFNHLLCALDSVFLAVASSAKHDVTDLVSTFAEVDRIRSWQDYDPLGFS